MDPPQRAAGRPGVAGAPGEERPEDTYTTTEAWAHALCSHCADHPKYSPEVMKEGARLGDGLVLTAGGWKEAVDCYREAWKSQWGNNLDGVFDEELCELLDPDLRDYLHEVVRSGVPARQPLAQIRVPSKPHESVRGHLEEAMEKLWKTRGGGGSSCAGRPRSPT